MPTIKDYASKKKRARRRPGREELDEENEEVDEDASEEIAAARPVVEAAEDLKFEPSAEPISEPTPEENAEPLPERKKVHIEFPYSEAVRAKVPKAFAVAETVAEEWVNDGNFENVPVGHPLAQITVAAGLRKAKKVEQKLEEKGVFMMAKMGLEYAKSKLSKK